MDQLEWRMVLDHLKLNLVIMASIYAHWDNDMVLLAKS